jgi:hypothetical protein
MGDSMDWRVMGIDRFFMRALLAALCMMGRNRAQKGNDALVPRTFRHCHTGRAVRYSILKS